MSVIADATLVGDVPLDIRENFERARQLHMYGVLQYEFFTVASEYSLLVLAPILHDETAPRVTQGAVSSV